MARLINKTQGFTVVSNKILRDKELGIKERGLLITLLSLPNNWEFSVKGISAILPDGRDMINATIKKLEAAGYIKRVQAKNNQGRFCGYDWEILDTPERVKPLSENPFTEKPFTEKPLSENPQQSITNKSIKKELNTISINHSFIQPEGKEKKGSARAELELLIGFEMLQSDEIALDLFELCVEVCDSSEDIRLNGRVVPLSIFQEKIKSLYYEDLIRVANQIRNQTHEIKNIKNYMLAALYNETVVSNTYYANKVAVDMS